MRRLKKALAAMMSVSLVMSQLSAISYASQTRSNDEKAYELVLNCELEKELACEDIVHAHDDSCYGLLNSTDSNASDSDAKILKCDIDEHEHDDDCYIVHKHGEDCYEKVEKKQEDQGSGFASVFSLSNPDSNEYWTYATDSNASYYYLNKDVILSEGMEVEDGAVIIVDGNCIIDAGSEENAITCDGDLTIIGDGSLTLEGVHGISAASVSIEDIKVDIDAIDRGIRVYNVAGDAVAELINVDGEIVGGFAGIHVSGAYEGSDAEVVIDSCDLKVRSTATSWNSRARKSGITVYVSEARKVESSITITNSKVNAKGFDAGLSINNYVNGDTNSASSRINIDNSIVVAEGTNGTWSGIFASVLGTHPDADSIINITDSSVYAVSPNTGILTSSQRGESKIILDNSILGASGKTALSMIEPSSQVQAAELKNGSTYVQMTPDAVMKGEISNFNGKTIVATGGDGITYNEEKNYFTIPKGSSVTETFTNGAEKAYTFKNRAGGIGGFTYEKEEIWGYDLGDVCYIKETGVYYETLSAAVADANASEGADTIVMIADIEFDSASALSIIGDVTIEGNHTVSRGTYAGTLFSVSKNATLRLDGGLVLDGNNNWIFDSENYYADMEAGLTLSTGAKESYSASETGGITSNAAMITVSGTKGALAINNATIQNNWGPQLFNVPAGASLTMGEGSLLKHIRGQIMNPLKGTWIMNDGKIEDVFAHNTNGGLVDIRDKGTFTINGGEITDVKTLGLNANGNGILVQAYGEGAKFTINDCNIHDNASFSPGGGWGAAVYMNRGGDFTMNGGTIKNTKSDHCTAFVSNRSTSIELLGGTIEVDPSKAARFDSLIYGDVIIDKDMNIVGTNDAVICLLGDPGDTLTIEGLISGGTIELMYSEPVVGDGTVTSDVLIKWDDYFEFWKDVILTGADWLDSVITVDSVGTDASLNVEGDTFIKGKQVRVLDSVTSADYRNIEEAKEAQAASYVEEEGAQVESPVLYFHRLTSSQKNNIVVTYDYNGGLDASGWSGCQITNADSFIPTSPVPTMEGYELVGWGYAVNDNPESLSMDIASNYNGEMISESLRLIAKWASPAIPVTITVQDATCVEGETPTFSYIADVEGLELDITFSVDGNIINAVVAEKEGYVFTVIPGTLTVIPAEGNDGETTTPAEDNDDNNEPETTPQPPTEPETSADVITETVPATEPETLPSLPYVDPDATPEDIPEEVVQVYYESYRRGEIDLDDIPFGVLGAFFEKGFPMAVLPATGSNTAFWLMMSVLSALGLAGTSMIDRKKRK